MRTSRVFVSSQCPALICLSVQVSATVILEKSSVTLRHVKALAAMAGVQLPFELVDQLALSSLGVFLLQLTSAVRPKIYEVKDRLKQQLFCLNVLDHLQRLVAVEDELSKTKRDRGSKAAMIASAAAAAALRKALISAKLHTCPFHVRFPVEHKGTERLAPKHHQCSASSIAGTHYFGTYSVQTGGWS